MKRQFHEHQLVVYQKQKHGNHPGRRAHDVRPTVRGETYDYVVDKYWLVVSAPENGPLVLRTPGGKLHEVDPIDPRLRRATWLERAWLAVSARERLRALHHPHV